jgi:hypothetical protein
VPGEKCVLGTALERLKALASCKVLLEWQLVGNKKAQAGAPVHRQVVTPHGNSIQRIQDLSRAKVGHFLGGTNVIFLG